MPLQDIMADFGATYVILGEYFINCSKVDSMPLTTFVYNGKDFDLTGPELIVEVSRPGEVMIQPD